MAPGLSLFMWDKRQSGDAGSAQAPGVGTGSDAGASGESSNSVDLSTGGLVAIIVVVIAVVVLGGMSQLTRNRLRSRLMELAQPPLQHSSGSRRRGNGPSRRRLGDRQRKLRRPSRLAGASSPRTSRTPTALRRSRRPGGTGEGTTTTCRRRRGFARKMSKRDWRGRPGAREGSRLLDSTTWCGSVAALHRLRRAENVIDGTARVQLVWFALACLNCTL
jgi:hypothetical protein